MIVGKVEVYDLMEVSKLSFIWKSKWIVETLSFYPIKQLLKCCRGGLFAKHWEFKWLTRPSLSLVFSSPSGLKLCKPSWFIPGRFLPYCRRMKFPSIALLCNSVLEENSLVVDSLLVVDGIWLHLWIPFVCSVAACMLPSTSFCLCFYLERNP